MKRVKYIEMSTLFMVITMILSLVLATEAVYDNDIWWHLKTGEYILENHTIPTTDIFSYYGIENQFEWTAHEWLSDIVLYLFYKVGGFNGLILFPILTLFITLLIIFKMIKIYYEQNYLIGGIWFFAGSFILSVYSSTRPHMFSFILLSLTTYILHDYIKNNSKKIWLLPLLSLLWVNLHGGSSALIFVSILLVIISHLFKFNFHRLEGEKITSNELKTLVKVLVGSMITGLINPYSYKILLYPVVNMLDKTMLSFISEWQSPNFHEIDGIVVLIVLAIPMLYLLISKKKINLYELLILGAFTYLSLKSIRLTSYFTIAITPVVMNHLPTLKLKEKVKKPYLNFIIVVLVLLFFGFNFIKTNLKPTDTSKYPKEAIASIKETKPKRMLNHYNWGGYLIWELYDNNIYPFIDGRADIFSKKTMNDYENITHIKSDWQKLFDKYDFDSILLYKDSILVQLLSITGEWEVKYADDLCIFMLKSRDIN